MAGKGFASLTPERRKEIASAGGKAAQASGKAHRWTPEEAQAAGRKGGLVSGPKPSLRKENRIAETTEAETVEAGGREENAETVLPEAEPTV